MAHYLYGLYKGVSAPNPPSPGSQPRVSPPRRRSWGFVARWCNWFFLPLFLSWPPIYNYCRPICSSQAFYVVYRCLYMHLDCYYFDIRWTLSSNYKMKPLFLKCLWRFRSDSDRRRLNGCFMSILTFTFHTIPYKIASRRRLWAWPPVVVLQIGSVEIK